MKNQFFQGYWCQSCHLVTSTPDTNPLIYINVIFSHSCTIHAQTRTTAPEGKKNEHKRNNHYLLFGICNNRIINRHE